MNKQQLANRIWESANKMRSKIEANEYKDYILGFIFYKFLSEKEEELLEMMGMPLDVRASAVTEENVEVVKYIQSELGYFISFENLFSTWLKMGKDFDVSNVRDALSAFGRLIHEEHKKVFTDIFTTLDTGLSKLGDSAPNQTKAIHDLIHLIKDIPMDGRQGYDVLGFIYEYLISMFAANAGKKAGEFYTPHEVSQLMSEIVADHLKEKKEIEIYDPTSGSGSLLITIGKSVAKYIEGENKVKYYAQELKENTYNLTRMNLVMRGIIPDNIVTRNGDTLEEDWPKKDDSGIDDPLRVDAVVSNPPYSQHWNPTDKADDPRYQRFGVAPKTKADYAFLLHDLYHIQPDGIMTIVLPHGVLFRGGEEGSIRQNLIEYNHIDAIIGLPANIFFGTGIPTIIMVLKQKRDNDDVLIIDASKGFVKEGKNNKLRASDIKRIVDAYTSRATIPKFSRAVSREEIRANEYNLNIPRYVDSSEEAEHWDISSLMFGGVPEVEVAELSEYWEAFPTLRFELFVPKSEGYVSPASDDIRGMIQRNSDVQSFSSKYASVFADFGDYLKDKLVVSWDSVNRVRVEEEIGKEIFSRLATIPLVDRYNVYELLDENWQKISADLEVLQSEGFEKCRSVVPNYVLKKKGEEYVEEIDGEIGYILPFALIQQTYLPDVYAALSQKEEQLSAISSEIEELVSSLAEDEEGARVLDDENTKIVAKELTAVVKEILAEVETAEIIVLREYLSLSKKKEKDSFIAQHPEITWVELTNEKGNITKTAVTKYITSLQMLHEFPEDSDEYLILRANKLVEKEKELKNQIKEDTQILTEQTKERMAQLTDAECLSLLEKKWVLPLTDSLAEMPAEVVKTLTAKVSYLAEKYAVTVPDTEAEIAKAAQSLAEMIDELEGSEADMNGLRKWQELLSDE